MVPITTQPAFVDILRTHIRLVRLKQERIQQQLNQELFQQQSASMYRSQKLSYAQVTRFSSQPVSRTSLAAANDPKSEGNCYSFIQAEGNAVFGTDIFTIHIQNRNFASKYNALSGIQKQETLIEFILFITPGAKDYQLSTLNRTTKDATAMYHNRSKMLSMVKNIRTTSISCVITERMLIII